MPETIARDRREYMKQYNETHKERKAMLNHAYWEANKERINERRNAKHNCETCGQNTLSGWSTHTKTNKHQNEIQQSHT